MAIYKRENQYRGVNAHLQSYFQWKTGWAGFHGQHIGHLREAIQAVLPFETGYVVDTEDSLQIAFYDPLTDEVLLSRIRPDITIFRGEAMSDNALRAANTAAPTMEMPVVLTMVEPEDVPAVVIYKIDESEGLGRPITRIELLSPANKPGGSNYRDYVTKRNEILRAKIKLVEIDYHHRYHPTIPGVPDYTRSEPSSFPYNVYVSDSTPGHGKTLGYGFRVDDPIPAVAIPLEGNDTVALDFGAVYNHTFAANNIYGLRLVDYETLPEGFDSYDAVDQQRIRDCMARVAQRIREG